MERLRRSLRLDVCRPDHLAPLLGFVGNEFAEIGRRHWNWNTTQVSEPRPNLGIGEGSVDLFVEFVDDLGRRAFWRAYAEPDVHLVAWDKLAHGWDVRQRGRARRRGNR